MPLPKYYCDYCDKQFQDTPVARRRHLQGAMHQRAKKAWFDSFVHDSQPAEASGQRMCSQFMRTALVMRHRHPLCSICHHHCDLP